MASVKKKLYVHILTCDRLYEYTLILGAIFTIEQRSNQITAVSNGNAR